MGEHMPLHTCACLDHACRVRLLRHLLVGLSVYYLPIVNSTPLYLLVKGNAVETHIGARWSFDGAVVEVVSGGGAASSPHSMAQSMGNGTLLREVSPNSAIFALT